MGKLILKFRTSHHLTQLQLSCLLNITQQSVGRYELGKGKPKISVFLHLMDLFKKHGFKCDQLKLLNKYYK